MTNQSLQDWSDNNVLDDVECNEKEAVLFRELLAQKENKGDEGSVSSMTAGEILKGTVVEVTKDFVIVDVGLKSEGLVPVNEFSENDDVSIGAEVEVYLDQTEGSDGQIVLSKDKARRQRQWEYIIHHCDEGSIVEGKVLRKVKGGLMVDIGMEAFLPGSQVDNRRIKNLDEFLGRTFDFKILKINKERKNIVVSRRELLEDERNTKKAEVLESIQIGDVRKGVVKNITEFGVFLSLDGIDGLLHITDMSWKKIKHPSEMVELGQELEVIILSIDKEKGRVGLGLKQKESNPWEEIEKKYPPGTRVKGKIVNLVSYGAFIEIQGEENCEGLIHVSEMSWTKNITDPSEIVHVGEEVEAIVLLVQPEEGKISLGIKQTQKNPWDDVEEKYPSGTVVDVTVTGLTNFGAFVKIEEGIEGLIHISDLSWTKKISHPSEILQKGDHIQAIIQTIDRESKKITLSVKHLTKDPWRTIEQTHPVGSTVEGKVTKTTAFGAFVKIDGSDMEGVVHVNELSHELFEKVEDVIQVGDRVKALVVSVDPEAKKIALSIKKYLLQHNQTNQDDIVVKKTSKKKSEEQE